jgi:phosphomannomutase
LGGEVSGHFFFKDGHPGFDDGLYAALRLLQFLGARSEPLSGWYANLPKRHTSPELRIPCPENRKGPVMEALQHTAQESGTVCTLDGLKVLGSDFWWLIRPSHTESSLVVRWEAQTFEGFEVLQGAIYGHLNNLGIVI